MPPTPDTPWWWRHPWAAGLLFVPAWVALRAALMFAAGMDLHFDEAQYWTWSRHLDWSYYSKGPLLAWLIALSTSLFGDGEWQIRLPAWIASALLVVTLARFSTQVFESRAASAWTLLLALSTPLYFGLGQVMTTDIFLFLAWSVTLSALYRAVVLERHSAWLTAGAAAGLGALAKSSMALLPLAVFIWLLLTKRGRNQLSRPQPWLAVLIASILVSPIVLWNAAHDWVMFRHDEGHVGEAEPGIGYLVEFIASQWLLLSPIIAVLGVAQLWRVSRQGKNRFLWWVCVGILAFFVAKAFLGKVQPNWAAPAYLGLLVLFAGRLATSVSSVQNWARIGVALSVVLIALVFFAPAVGLDGRRDPLKELKHWREPIQQLALEAGDTEFLLTDRYRLASELAFYWPGNPPVFLTTEGRKRRAQFDLWPGPETQRGRNGVFVTDRDSLAEQAAEAFERCEPLTQRSSGSGPRPVRTLRAWRCWNFGTADWKLPDAW